MQFGLKTTTIEKTPKVEQVIIYGSHAKENYRNGSDIDITIKGEKLNSLGLEKYINRIRQIFYQKK